MFVKGQTGTAWVNGAKVVVINVETGFAQIVDGTHLYTEVFFLPDGTPLAKDVDGTVWALHAQERVFYFKPPAVPAGWEIGQYTLSRDLSHLAYVASERDHDGQLLHTELWVSRLLPVRSAVGAQARRVVNPLLGPRRRSLAPSKRYPRDMARSSGARYAAGT